MKLKDLVFPLAFALMVTMAINYFFFSGKKGNDVDGQVKSGQSFVAPKAKQEIRPLNKEIDFIDEKRLEAKVLTEVETDVGKFVFSNDGASLERASFKVGADDKVNWLNTVYPVADTQKENKCFLLALNEKTPYYYKFLGKTDAPDAIELAYRYDSPASDVTVDKKFTIYKKTNKIDLFIEITPKKELEEAIDARIFFPSPNMHELQKTDVVSAVVVDDRGSVKKIAKDKLEAHIGWFFPKLFGTDSKYFVHAMIDDANDFAQRAYYKIHDLKLLISILEGPQVKEKASWNVSFYFGPKEEQALANVDQRLEKTLEYSGWLAPISKFLLMILKFLYKYLKNYGLAIIVLTIFIRMLLFPFTIKAEAGMKKRLEFQKKLDYLQKKYKHDKAALARERAELIKKHGMPGLGGCLPLLLQIPIFFALSSVLRSSIELHQASFLWIKDLSAKDPYYILPIGVSLTMLLQSLTVEPKQRFTMVIMALILGPLFASFPAGLSLYIFFSILLGVLQTLVVKRFKS